MSSLYNILKQKICSEDDEKEVVKRLEDHNGRYIVEYDSKIRIEGPLRQALEDVATAYLVVQLVKRYGYPKDSIIIEKRRETGRTVTYFDIFTKKDSEIHVKTEKPLCILVEVKEGRITEGQELIFIKNQLIDPAFSFANDPEKPFPKFLIYYRVWVEQDGFKEKIKVVDFELFASLPQKRRDLKKILLDPQITIERIPYYQDSWTPAYKQLLKKESSYDLRPFQDLQEIIKVIDEVKNLVWRGRLKTERAFKFIIRFLLTKLWDEESTKKGEEYALQIKPQDTKDLSSFVNRVNEKYKEALHYLIDIPLDQAKQDDILIIEYEREGRPIRIDEKVLFEVVRRVQNYKFKADENSVDLLGEFFERFLWNEYKQEKGQFFTHPNLVRFTIQMLRLPEKFINKINQEEYPYVLDPACGSGTFLVEAMKSIDRLGYNNNILENIKGKRKHWAYELLYGIDVERDLVLAAKVNMIMHGDGSGSIFEADALDDFERLPLKDRLGGKIEYVPDEKSKLVTKRLYEKFQFIITNPPFSLPLGEVDAERLERNFLLADIFEKQTRGKSKSSEIFFIERWYQFLKEGGEIGVVLPESVFDTLEYFPLRLFILFRFKIKALISLPEHAFAPFAAQRTNLLFAEKRRKEGTLKLKNAFENLLSSLELEDEAFINEVYKIKSLEENVKAKILKIKSEENLSKEARAFNMLLEIFPEEKYKFFIALVKNIGYFRTKKSYSGTSKNDLLIVLKDYDKWVQSKNVDFKFSRSKIVSIEFIGETDDLRFDVKFLLRNRKGVALNDIVEDIRLSSGNNFKDWLNNINESTIKYIETGNITAKGEIGYIEISKNDLLEDTEEYEAEGDEERETTIANYVRILKKIRNGKITKLPSNCIIIAPARVYQAKMALIDDFFANNFYFSPDFIAFKPKSDNSYGIDIVEAFLLLKSRDVINELDKVSRIGKGGYPKLRIADLRYVKIPQKVIEECKNEAKKKIIKELVNKRKELFELIQKIKFD